jgi:hypothetical protein
MVTRKVPLFGSGSEAAVAMANRVTRFVHDTYGSYPHYRGGATRPASGPCPTTWPTAR